MMQRRLSMVGAVLLPLVVWVAGCGTLFEKDTREIIVTSDPPGGNVIINGAARGITPTRVKVNNHRELTIVVEKDGHHTGGCIINASIRPVWLIADIILITAVVPIVTDLLTGQWKSLQSSYCSVHLPVRPG